MLKPLVVIWKYASAFPLKHAHVAFQNCFSETGAPSPNALIEIMPRSCKEALCMEPVDSQ